MIFIATFLHILLSPSKSLAGTLAISILNTETNFKSASIDVGPLSKLNSTTEEKNSFPPTSETRGCLEDDEIFSELMKGYTRVKIPENKGNNSEPLSIFVEVWVQEISALSDITSDIWVDIYYSEVWTDPGLVFDHLNPCSDNLTLTGELLNQLWTPNTCFINSKKAVLHSSPFPNIWALVDRTGKVYTNFRMKVRGPCEMGLTMFPMDYVDCILTFESFNYNIDEVKMRWKEVNPLVLFYDLKEQWGNEVITLTTDYDKFVNLGDFSLLKMVTRRIEEPYSAGYWDELSMIFKFRRKFGWYLWQAYLPTYLTIFISWISFYLGSRAIPPRTMIGVNSLLALTFQFGAIINNLPRVSYVKAIDVWMMGCIGFIFATLLELALIGHLDIKNTKPRYTRPVKNEAIGEKLANLNDTKHIPTVDVTVEPIRNIFDLLKPLQALKRSKIAKYAMADRIDRISMVLFPLCFTIFNLFYWFYYAYYQQQ